MSGLHVSKSKAETRDCVALVRLERPGGGFFEVGERCELEVSRADVLIGMGLARLATKDDAPINPTVDPEAAA